MINWLGKKFGWSDERMMIADIGFTILVVVAMGIAALLIIKSA
jgi:hypothetical protein